MTRKEPSCEFYCLFLLDTQEVPTSLSLESSSSLESLTSDDGEEEEHGEHQQEGGAAAPPPPPGGHQQRIGQGRLDASVTGSNGVVGPGGLGGTGTVGRGGQQHHQSASYSGLVSRRMPLSASVKSAFSNYVRSGCRGEPDGRTAVVNDSHRGRESDAAFTPSPVDPVHRTSKGAHV